LVLLWALRIEGHKLQTCAKSGDRSRPKTEVGSPKSEVRSWKCRKSTVGTTKH